VVWPASTQFGKGRDASLHGRKGGRNSPHPRYRSPEWLQGYQAGWKASERWYAALGQTIKRGKHGNTDR
jgi:hypothetical protein